MSDASRETAAEALIAAAEAGDHGLVASLLKQKCNAEQSSSDGRTALQVAALEGHEQVCRLLLPAAGASLNAADNDGWTPLHCAVTSASGGGAASADSGRIGAGVRPSTTIVSP